jgi:PAS domain-containing protein
MYRLIHIEPDDAAHEAVLRAIADSPLQFTIERVDDPEAAAEPMAAASVDAVLLSAGGEAEALDLIDRSRRIFATQPLIIVAASADLRFAREALRAGAQDVVVRQEKALAVLSRILLYAIERAGAEMLRRDLEVEARSLAAVVDAVFAHSRDGVVQLDASGTIQRLSPAAATLLGLEITKAPGCRLVSRVRHQEAARLQALLDAARPGGRPSTATFKFEVDGATRMLEVRPLPLGHDSKAPPCLLELTELAADFTAEEPAATGAPAAAARAPAVPPQATGERIDTAARASGGVSVMERPAPPAAATPAEAPKPAATQPLALIKALDGAARWKAVRSVGAGADWGFLVADPKSAAALARLAAVCRDDPDVALAIDELRLRAWQKLAAAAPNELPALIGLELSYSTSVSRPHLDQYLEAVIEPPGQLFKRAPLVLGHVPKGVHVPTLAKTLRSLAARRDKPALQLPTLDTDLRALPLGELALLILDVDELKQALAKDRQAVTALLDRAAQQGCPTMVRGAGGPLAQALRSRLGVDLTVEG